MKSRNYNSKKKELLSLSNIYNNKIPFLSPKKLNYKSFDNSSFKKLDNNKKNSINYLNYRQKLFKKCNSQILENKEILPILSNKNNKNNINSPKIKRNNDKIFLCETPVKSENKNQNNEINIPFLSDLSKEKNKNINDSIKQNNSKSLIKSENNEENNNENNIFEISLNSSKKMNIDNSNNNTINSIFKNDERKRKIFSPFKHSKFYQYSKHRNVSAKKIYEHYILEEIKQNVIPIDNFTKFIEKKFNSPQNKLNKLYSIDKSYSNNIEEIKSNKYIAYKEDFNIEEYQKILLGMVKKRINQNSLFYLKQNFKKFNEKLLRGYEVHKGRYTKLADKIRNCAPIYLVNKLKKLDDEKIRERAKYFGVNLNKKKEIDTFDQFEYYIKNKFIPNIDLK